jgi:hypothetical protein
MIRERNETRDHGKKIMFETVLVRRTSPLRTVATSRSSTFAISSGVTSLGPKLKNVSKLFGRVRYRGSGSVYPRQSCPGPW